jgi:hypothetical protein
MLNAVLRELNNYFYRYTLGVKTLQFSVDSTFTATDTITGVFADTFVVGEYVQIYGSRVNDGVYLISAIDDSSMTIDATLDIVIKAESTAVTCTFTKLFIPPDVVQLIADIKTYDTNIETGIRSESQGERSVTYGGGSSTSASGWKDAFASNLSTYKKVRWCG